MTKPKKAKKATKPRGNLVRDLEILKQHMPAELGGEGLTVEDIAAEEGVTRWAIYKRLEREDVKEAERAWVRYIVGSQRDLGPVAVKALGRLLEAGDSATVNAFFKRMGPPEPVADVAIEKLEIKFSPATDEILKLQNPNYHPAAAGSYPCPVVGCSYTTADIGQLGDHLQEVHCSGQPNDEEEK